MRLRIFHPGRLVFRLRRRDTVASTRESWLALHRGPQDWRALLSTALHTLVIPAEIQANCIHLSGGAGEVQWSVGWLATRFELTLRVFSPRKRALVAAALLKALRHH